jgi:hypothetical protein
MHWADIELDAQAKQEAESLSWKEIEQYLFRILPVNVAVPILVPFN